MGPRMISNEYCSIVEEVDVRRTGFLPLMLL